MKSTLVAAGLALGVTSMALAGNTWHEDGDAGNGVNGDAQATGTGPLAAIIGSTNGNVGDEVDAYCITVVDYQNFTASLSNAGTTFDTQIWLFDANGHLVSGNDDNPAGGLQSFLQAGPNDDGTPGLTANGTYIIAVSGFNNDPTDAAGADLAIQDTFQEQTGADGPGGANPLGGWGGGGATGDYEMTLTGVDGWVVPAPGALALLGVAGLAAGRRRRH